MSGSFDTEAASLHDALVSCKIPEIKKAVDAAHAALEIADECVMRQVREELGIGTVTAVPGVPRGIAAKMNIEDLLGIEINSCRRFRGMLRRRSPGRP